MYGPGQRGAGPGARAREGAASLPLRRALAPGTVGSGRIGAAVVGSGAAGR